MRKNHSACIASFIVLMFVVTACAPKEATTNAVVAPSVVETKQETPSSAPSQVAVASEVTEAIRYVDEEIEKYEAEKRQALSDGIEALTKMSTINLLMTVPPPTNFNLKDALIDEGVGVLLGKMLGDVYDYYGYEQTIQGIITPDDVPTNMIYTVQTFSVASALTLKHMVDSGITEQNYDEAVRIAETYYNYQQSLFSNFNVQEVHYSLADYYKELQKANRLIIDNYNAKLTVLNVAKESLEEITSEKDAEVAAFVQECSAYNDQYAKFMAASVKPMFPDANYGTYAENPAAWTSGFLLPYLNFDPLRILLLEGKTNRAANIASLVGSVMPLGGTLSAAYNSLDADGKANICLSILLPNVFYQEYAVKQQNNAYYLCAYTGDMLMYCNELIKNSQEESGSGVSTTVLQALHEGQFMQEYLNKQIREISVAMNKMIYTDVMAAELYALVLSDDVAQANNNFINNIFDDAVSSREWLWSNDLMKTTGSFKNTTLAPGETLLTFSSEAYFSDDAKIEEACVAEMDQIRKQYADTLVQIVDLSMDNNQLDATAKGSSKIGYLTPIGVDGNKIYYDQKMLYNGAKAVLKGVEVESPQDTTPRYVCYFNVIGYPVYARDMKTSKDRYVSTTLLSKTETNPLSRVDIRRIGGTEDDPAMKDEINAWLAVQRDLGVKPDGSVTRDLDRLRQASANKN